MKRPWNNEGGDGATVERTADAADPQARRFKKGVVRAEWLADRVLVWLEIPPEAECPT